MGKRGAALGLAMALNCAMAPGAGCGACEICRRIEAGLHPDVPTLRPVGPRRADRHRRRAQAILALARSRPHEAEARVIVVDDADAMNPSAANCLLKTLEEPLARNHLVLCTSAPDRLLPTIRSRTQRVRFRPLSVAELLELARRRAIPDARAEIAATLADGSAARLCALAGRGRRRRRGARRWRRCGRRSSRPAPRRVFDFAAAQASDKRRQGGQGRPRHGCST